VTGPDVRIGDREREAALTALGEHLTAGRLTLDEYGDRSAQAAHAQTRGALAALFEDLPEPHPDLDGGSGVVAVTGSAPVVRDRTAVRRAVQVSTTLMWAVGVPLLFILGGSAYWWLIFVPIAVSIVAGQYLGDSSCDDDEPERRELER
jgi:hypothetical protein